MGDEGRSRAGNNERARAQRYIQDYTPHPPGTRGGEGNTILSLEPESRLAFSWNAPPSQPQTRSQHTVVELRFTALSHSATEVELLHRGFGPGPAWDETYSYFQAAWTMVMDRFVDSMSRRRV